MTLPEAYQPVKDIIELLIIPAFGFLWRELSALRKEVRRTNEIAIATKITLIGVDGRNGLRSRVYRNERRIERLANAVASSLGVHITAEKDSEEE